MTENDETQVLPALSSNGHSTVNKSLVDVLRAKREEHVTDKTYDLEVPGMQGLLVLRLRPVNASLLSRLRERMERSKSPEREVDLSADTLLAACIEVLGRANPNDEPQPLDNEQPVTLSDPRLGELLGFEAASGREAVLQVFAGAPSPGLALGIAMGDYVQWASAANEEADEAYLGESPAAAR